MMPLNKNHDVLAPAKPWPSVCAKSPSRNAAMSRRPRFARAAPSERTLWLAQVALSAKKKAARNEASIAGFANEKAGRGATRRFFVAQRHTAAQFSPHT